ncbi:unnamed protein product [Linum trigynum]|uniref:Uncharacterized protein n=1 Tax=Linum trigynum TaxID=586398 RepID=A0AAV2C8E8_9ROSI
MNRTVALRRRMMEAAAVLVIMMLLVTPTSPTCHPSPPSHRPSPSPHRGGSGCKQCVVEQLQYGCPKCTPILRCMARCLWGGAAKSRCVEKCDCGGGKPTLADCRGCMSRCKCSCL